jgi:hypothetical protein
LIVLPWVLGIGLALRGWEIDRMIAQRQRTTKGTVTTHEPANHSRYGYTFFVNGKSYSGWEIPKKEDLNIGQYVTVFYDPLDPAKNALTDFEDRATESAGPVPAMLFGIGAVALIIHYGRRRVERLHRSSEAR